MPGRSQIYQSMERTPSPPSRVNTTSTTASQQSSPYSNSQQASPADSPSADQSFFHALTARVRRDSRGFSGEENESDSASLSRSRSRQHHPPPTAAAPLTQARPAATEASGNAATTGTPESSASHAAHRQYSLSSDASTLVESLPRPSVRPAQQPSQEARRRQNTSRSTNSRSNSNMWYGRHANSWLFNDFSVREHVKVLLPKRKRRDS